MKQMRRADGGGRAAGADTPQAMGWSWRGYGMVLARSGDGFGEVWGDGVVK